MDKVSVESFEAMEKLCENSLNPRDQDDSDDSLGDLSVPDFNDTLEEVDFMLSLGKKLQSRGVMKYPIPTVRVQAEDECTTPKSSAMHSSFVARLMARTSTSPVDPIEEFSYCCEDNQVSFCFHSAGFLFKA